MSGNGAVRAQAKIGSDNKSISVIVFNGESYTWDGSVCWLTIL